MINQPPTHRIDEPLPPSSFPDSRPSPGGGLRLLPTRASFRHICASYGVSIWTAFPAKVFRADFQGAGTSDIGEAVLRLDDLFTRNEMAVGLPKLRAWIKAEAKLQSLLPNDEERLGLDSGVFKPLAKPIRPNTRIGLVKGPL